LLSVTTGEWSAATGAVLFEFGIGSLFAQLARSAGNAIDKAMTTLIGTFARGISQALYSGCVSFERGWAAEFGGFANVHTKLTM
jgi:hypothetical protein